MLPVLSLISFGFNVPAFAAQPGPDMGYGNLPKFYVDVNGDGARDFCRFVGNHPDIILSCQLGISPSGYSSEQYGFNSQSGLDLGYGDRPRSMKDVNGDKRKDFCRYIGNFGDSTNPVRESCVLAGQNGFTNREYRLDR